MKNILLIIIIILLLGIIGFLFINNRNIIPSSMLSSTPSAQDNSSNITVTNTVDGYCTPNQLKAAIEPEVAAGNYYGQITITNTSQSSCQVIGNNTLEVNYPVSVTNFKTVSKGNTTASVFTLEPNQTIYSLIHFPNGPQCSSTATDVNAMISYAVSPTESVSFTPTMGTTVDIPSCGNPSEMTTIDLYPFSTQVVTP